MHRELDDLIGDDPGKRLPVFPREIPAGFDDDLIADVVCRYRGSKPDPTRGGAMMLVTAGPPGSGKSHWVGRSLDVNSDYLLIDPDEIKDLLLVEARTAGLLDDAAGLVLADGKPVSDRELSGRVHEASTKVASFVRQRALRQRENVIMEGTLSWPDLARLYAGELLEHEYERLDIVDVEVPPTVAVEGALARWWAGRTGDDPLGGRFLPTSAVHAHYAEPVGEQRLSTCARVADDLWKYTHDVMDVFYRRIERDGFGNETVLPIHAVD